MKQNKKEEKGKQISFGYNMKIFLGFLSNYKLLMFLCLFAVFIIEARHVTEKYLFKILVDNGTNYETGKLALSSFMNLLGILAVIYVGIVIIGFILIVCQFCSLIHVVISTFLCIE